MSRALGSLRVALRAGELGCAVLGAAAAVGMRCAGQSQRPFGLPCAARVERGLAELACGSNSGEP